MNEALNFVHWLSERLAPIAIMGVPLKAPLSSSIPYIACCNIDLTPGAEFRLLVLNHSENGT